MDLFVGVKDVKKLMEDIPNKVRDVLGILVDINLHVENGLDYLEIIVKPSIHAVSYKGEFHYRSGATKQHLVGQALTQFLLKKSGITWDSVLVDGINIDELRHDSFDLFREYSLRNNRMTQSDLEISNRQLLENLNLVDDDRLTRAGVLLFYHQPERWIAGAFIKIGFFESDADLLYQDEVHGSLLSQADKTVDLIFTKYLKAIITYDIGRSMI